MTEHLIDRVADNSIAKELGIRPGDILLSVNGQDIEDIFDYQYQCENVSLDITIKHTGSDNDGADDPDINEQSHDTSVITYHVEKDEDADLGLVFSEGLMDDYRHCSNKCIFCFIDQNPPGMRDTLYFKDDDARLSFLQGNYITLTNMSDHDVDRIIKYRLQPVNISFHTMNPELRCRMLNNRFAGEALKKAERLFEAGITMNGQIVLCKGVNDGSELEYSLSKLYEYVPLLESLSVVPVGLTKYRDGLYPLLPFEKEDALDVIKIIERWQKKAYTEKGTHFVHASDEFYITGEVELPEEDTYDGYLQIQNGVGMMRSYINEFDDAIEEASCDYALNIPQGSIMGKIKRTVASRRYGKIKHEKLTLICGRLGEKYIRLMAKKAQDLFPCKDITVLPIDNRFFGERITVTGLLTGQDIIGQCREYQKAGGDLGSRLLMSNCILRSGTDTLLDDVTVKDIEDALQVQVDIVKSSGYDLLEHIIR